MRFNLKALKELKAADVTRENFAEKLQDPEGLETIARIAIEAGGGSAEPDKLDNVTPGEVLDAWLRDVAGETVKKLQDPDSK